MKLNILYLIYKGFSCRYIIYKLCIVYPTKVPKERVDPFIILLYVLSALPL